MGILPENTSLPGHEEFPGHIAGANGEKAAILLVDDSPSKLLSLQSILEELNQNIVTAQSGREALRKVLHQEFAVIILDVHMPDLDGYETAELFRQRPRSESTPIILVSDSNQTETHMARGYSLGAVDYIFMPIIPDILRAKVRVFAELARKNREIQRQGASLREIEARKLSRALTGATERLRLALEVGRMASWEWDIATDRFTWSPVEAGGLLSAPTASQNFEGFLQTVHPADQEHLRKVVDEALAQPREFRVEIRCLCPSDSPTWIEMRGRVLDDDGLRMVGVCTDIDKQKRFEDRRA